MELMMQQRQELKLLMTAQLRQSIELLQYSTDDLEQFIRQQELENPLIELQDSSITTQVERLPSFKKLKRTALQPTDISKPIEENFRDQLMQMVKLNFKDDSTKKLLTYMIHNLNDNGYLEMEGTGSNYSTECITKGIELLQQIGPIGIGARNLEECLSLQSQYRYPEYPMLEEIIQHYLPLLAEKKWSLIAKNLKCSVSQVGQLSELILTLNPRPCSLMQIGSTEYLRPDIIVEEHQNELIFYLNDYYLPSIKLNEYYLTVPNTNRDDQQYIHTHYKNYQWLMNSIEQRRNTIIKIMHVLMKRQLPFFSKGLSELIPLTLKEVADEIEMHESTVSRATSNKYIQTPIGTFELKSLFTSKVATNDGGNISQEKVKTLLKQFIQKEDKLKPFSDQKIAEYFNTEHAIQIARRTISKYRDELNIPSASMRKQWK
ncbi:RNA polymerase factor sigma-54 [Rummeliibacillus sp. NPDC094406]|uniref:RNA polymerase factor sigma-54 n=1 Tax=Rummeliibacillus sp. NPDC094406 TaxID=3364511 RepID=UPI0037F6B488